MVDSCSVKYCREEPAMSYYGKRICNKHWVKHCHSEIDLKKELQVGEWSKRHLYNQQLKLKWGIPKLKI